MSAIYPIPKGLPQGGALPPLLWLAFFNPLISRHKEMREENPLDGVAYSDSVYAADITTIITTPNEELPQMASKSNEEHVHKELSIELSL